MTTVYYWNGEEIQEEVSIYDVSRTKHFGQPCVDTALSDAAGRYGQMTRNGWRSIPFNKFPKEFRMHLLLLGVS